MRTRQTDRPLLRTATQYLGDLVSAACTLNEPNIAPLLTKAGIVPPPDPQRCAQWRLAATNSSGTTPDRLVPFIPAASDQAVEATKAEPGDFPVRTERTLDINPGSIGGTYKITFSTDDSSSGCPGVAVYVDCFSGNASCIQRKQ